MTDTTHPAGAARTLVPDLFDNSTLLPAVPGVELLGQVLDVNVRGGLVLGQATGPSAG